MFLKTKNYIITKDGLIWLSKKDDKQKKDNKSK